MTFVFTRAKLVSSTLVGSNNAPATAHTAKAIAIPIILRFLILEEAKNDLHEAGSPTGTASATPAF
jgi:hypothetical protein